MLPNVTFVHVARCSAGKQISQEEGAKSLIPSSTVLLAAGRLKQLYMNMQAQSVCSRFEASDVISFHLGQVITPR